MFFFSKAERQISELEKLIDFKKQKKIKVKNRRVKLLLKTIKGLKMGEFTEKKELGNKILSIGDSILFYSSFGETRFYTFKHFGLFSIKIETNVHNQIIKIEDRYQTFKDETEETIEFFIDEFKSLLKIIDFDNKWKAKINNVLERHDMVEKYKERKVINELSTNFKLGGKETLLIEKIEKIIPRIEEKKSSLDFEDVHEFEKITYTKFVKIIQVYKGFTNEQKERNRGILIDTLESVLYQLKELKTKIEKREENEFLKIAETLNSKSQIF